MKMRGAFLALAALAAITSPALAKGPFAEPPTRIALVWQYWGRTLNTWTIDENGQGRFTDEHRDVAFAVTPEEFARVREVLRPHEGAPFSCRRVITDGAYGSLTWSGAEGAEHEIRFDAGCVSGDADALFARIEQVEALLTEMRDTP